tara:strand:+ start:451 stop:753 length:303 start_codon:yes stop_codon:yes gene_type:complete
MSNKKRKIHFKEEDATGPYGVGDSFEEVSNLNIFEHLVSSGQLKTMTQDLDEKQTEHVIKEAKAHADGYQKVLDHVSNLLSTKEGQEMFKQMILKKAGER